MMKFSGLRQLRGYGLISAWGLLLLVGCAGQKTVQPTAQGQFAAAEKAFQDEDYLSALERFRLVKNRFPYSPEAVSSELRLADTFFEQESYLEAQSAYEIFSELHPSDSRIDYVDYKMALSAFNQIPENTTRDLTAAQTTLALCHRFMAKHPSSSYTKQVKVLLTKTKRAQAEHTRYVADFYFRRQQYLSSALRYAALLRNFTNSGYDEEALYRLAQSYYHIQRYQDAKEALSQLKAKFPSSKWSGEAEDLSKALEENANRKSR